MISQICVELWAQISEQQKCVFVQKRGMGKPEPIGCRPVCFESRRRPGVLSGLPETRNRFWVLNLSSSMFRIRGSWLWISQDYPVNLGTKWPALLHHKITTKNKTSEGDDTREILVHKNLLCERGDCPGLWDYLVVWLQSLNVRHFGALCVEVKLTGGISSLNCFKVEWKYLLELLDPFHNLLILWPGQVVIIPSSVPRVARVKPESMMEVLESPDCPEASLRDGGSHLCHVVHQHLNVNSSQSLVYL